jgi:AraC-like DNA-binding protein
MNFSTFINRLRVDAAKRDLLLPGEILTVALDVGFRSKASFNRAFKEYAGCTPSEWRSRAKAERLES